MRWKPYGGKYEVSETGEVRNSTTKRVLKCEIDRDGHPRVSMYLSRPSKKRISILVLSLFDRRAKDNEIAAFKDGDPSNVALSNLSWSTRSLVFQKKETNFQRGSAKSCSKLTEEDIPKILRRRWVDRETLSDIANTYDVNIHTIHHVCAGRTWKAVKCKERNLIPKRLLK